MGIPVGNHNLTLSHINNTPIFQYEDYQHTPHKELYLQLQFATGLFCYPLVCMEATESFLGEIIIHMVLRHFLIYALILGLYVLRNKVMGNDTPQKILH